MAPHFNFFCFWNNRPSESIFACLFFLSAPNPCATTDGRSPCSHLCLINFNQTFSCACPHLMKLQPDKRTCKGNRQTDTGHSCVYTLFFLFVFSLCFFFTTIFSHDCHNLPWRPKTWHQPHQLSSLLTGDLITSPLCVPHSLLHSRFHFVSYKRLSHLTSRPSFVPVLGFLVVFRGSCGELCLFVKLNANLKFYRTLFLTSVDWRIIGLEARFQPNSAPDHVLMFTLWSVLKLRLKICF